MGNKAISRLIRDVADDNDLSLRQLAFRSGMDAQTINSLLTRDSVSTKSLSRIFDTVDEELIIMRKNKKYIINE